MQGTSGFVVVMTNGSMYFNVDESEHLAFMDFGTKTFGIKWRSNIE
jgi:hypothetical protein